ncbi:unnamed protein product, partial [Adineta steineri]
MNLLEDPDDSHVDLDYVGTYEEMEDDVGDRDTDQEIEADTDAGDDDHDGDDHDDVVA